MLQKAVALFAFCLSAAAVSSPAQTLFAVPGPTSSGQNVFVFTGNPLSSVTGVSAGTGAFDVLALPGGSKYYIISNSTTNSIVSVGNTFTASHAVANLPVAPTEAALTPDGRRLIVLARTLHVYDTTTDTELTPSGGIDPNNDTLTDLAISLDGSRIFLIGTTTAGSGQIFAIDPSTFTILGSANLAAAPIAVSVGLNALVYVSLPNQILELNPFTLATTSTIIVNGRPGKVAFSPEGRYAYAANQTPVPGPAIFLIDLNSKSVTGGIPAFGVTFSRIFAASTTQIYALSPTTGLYQLTLVPASNNLSINTIPVAGLNAAAVTGAALSNEVSSGVRALPQFLYVTAGGVLYRIDLAGNAISSQAPLASPTAGLVLTASPSSAAPAALLQYGNNQTVATGAVSEPLVVRVLDAQGNPVSGASVAFAPNNATATVQPAVVTTTNDGFAETLVTAPAAAGALTVTATAGGVSVPFNLNVSSSVVPGGVGGLSIVSGQGQVTFENFNTAINGSPLTVRLADAAGNPLPNRPVTFQVTSGPGSVIGGTITGFGAGNVVTTDQHGLASVAFQASTVPPGTGFAQATITVTSPNTAPVNFYVTFTPQSEPVQVTFIKPAPGTVLTGPAGSVIAGAIQAVVTSSQGTPIPNVGIRIDNTGIDTTALPFGTCVDATGTGVLSDNNGLLSCDLKLGGRTGNGFATANVGYFLQRSFNIAVTAGSAGAVQILSGNNQSGMPGQQLPAALLVQVTDAFGNVLPNTPVTFTVVSGSATLQNTSTASDFSGKASTLLTLGNQAGPVQVKVTAGTASATFTATNNVPTAAIALVSGNTQTALAGTAFGAPLVVKVTDANGNPVAGAQVTFAVTSGTATVATATAVSDANGLASTTVNAGATTGPVTVTATSATFTTTFNLTVGQPGPSNVVLVNGASFQSGISPGSIVTITGTGIATGITGVVTPTNIVGPLPTSLANVSVTFNGTPAPIYNVANVNGHEQVTVQVPYEVAPGTVNVTVTGAGGGSATVTTTVQPFAPGVFTTTAYGGVQAVAQRPDGTFVSPSNPAHRGEVIHVFATGLGQTTPATSTNAAGIGGQNVAAPVVVGINNAGVRLVSADLVQGLVGVYDVALQIPADTAPGTQVPVGLIVYDAAGNPYFAPGTTIPVV